MSENKNEVYDSSEQNMESTMNSVANTASKAGKKATKNVQKKAAMMAKKIIMQIAHMIAQAIMAILSALWPIILAVLAVCSLILILAGAWHFITNLNVSNNQVYQNETVSYTDDESSEGIIDSINNAWAGVFYTKYADQSLYSVISEADGNDDMYSGKTYEELGGTDKTEILLQSGSDEFKSTNVKDIDNYEDQLKLNSGFLSVLDNRLNNGYKVPEQFIKPIYSTCTKENNYEDIGSCELLLGEDDNIATAESNGYTGEDKENATFEPSGEKSVSVSDWGLGSIAHYKAYYQPSRVNDYEIKTVTIIDPDWKPSDGGSPLKTMNWDSLTQDEKNEILETYKRGAEGVLDKNDDNTYNTGLYNVNPTIVYKDWNKAIEKSVGLGSAFSNWLNNRTQSLYSDDNRDLWASGDPGISSGVPDTEIVYAITDAVTMYGKINFDIRQEWITQGITDHTQRSTYLKTYQTDKVSNDDVVKSYDGAKGYKAVYDNGQLIGYMNGDAKGTYVAPQYIEDTSDACKKGVQVCYPDPAEPSGQSCHIEYHCDPAQPYWKDGYWQVQLVMDTKGNPINETKTITVKQTDAHKEDRLTFAVAYKVVVSALTEGDLQTLTVIHSDANITTDQENSVKYLEDYIKNYETYIPADIDAEVPNYLCYADQNNQKLAGWSIDSAKDTVPGTSSSTVDDITKCDPNSFANLDDTDQATHTMQKFYFEEMPTMQYLKGASLLGFVDGSDDISSVMTSDLNIIEEIGSNNDMAYKNMTDTYGTLFDRYGGAYGVDPKLLALIASQEFGNVCPGDYYNDDADYHFGNCNLMQIEAGNNRTFTAYNFNLRENTGNKANENTTFYDVLKTLFNAGNKSDKIVGQISTGSMETFSLSDADMTNGKNGLSGVELSIKAAAMYLQNLLNYYEGNLPLSIMAYNYGTNGVDQLLTIYEQQTGILKETAIENPYELGWTHYAEEIHTNPTKYIPDWNEDTFGDADYLAHVLSRMQFPALYYVRTEKSAEGTDTVKGSAGVWINYNVEDSEMVNNKTQKESKNTQYVNRAYKRLSKNDQLKDNWDIFTSGQVDYNRGYYVKDGKIDVSDTTYNLAYRIKPEKNQNDIDMIIKTAFAFNSDKNYTDIDYESKEFWQSKFLSTMGNGINKISSAVDPNDLFGEGAIVVYPINEYRQKTEIINEFGVTYTGDNVREYNDHEALRMTEDSKVYSSTNGVVTKVEMNVDGTWFVQVDASNDSGKLFDEIFVEYNGLNEVNVNVGDTLTITNIIGQINEGNIGKFYLMCDGEANDLFGVADIYKQRQDLLEMKFNLSVKEGDNEGTFPPLNPGWVPEIDDDKIRQFLEKLVTKEGGSYTSDNCIGDSMSCDCSGLVYGVLKSTIAPDLYDMTADTMMHALTDPISRADLRPGDLVYFYKGYSSAAHVAVYMGPDENGVEYIFHALNPSSGILYSKFQGSWCMNGDGVKYDSWEAAALSYGRIKQEWIK